MISRVPDPGRAAAVARARLGVDAPGADRPQEARLVGLPEREHAVVLHRLVGRQRAQGLGQRGEGAAVDDPERLADGGGHGEPGPGGVGPRIEHLDPEQLREVGRGAASAQPIRRRRAGCVAEVPPIPRLSARWRSPPTSARRCSCCSSAARATTTSRSCSDSPSPRSAPAPARRSPSSAAPTRTATSGSPTTCSARPTRSGAPTPPATCATTPPTTSSPTELCERLRELFPAADLPRLPGQPRPAGGVPAAPDPSAPPATSAAEPSAGGAASRRPRRG